MPYSHKKIRVLTLAVIKQDRRIFMTEGFDPLKQEVFYRALGGGVDFGESSLEGLRREFKEEINAELTNIKYLGCIESIFEFRGEKGHEIIQLYQADFADPKFYSLERIKFNEGKREKTALWLYIEPCKSGSVKVVPEQFLAYL